MNHVIQKDKQGYYLTDGSNIYGRIDFNIDNKDRIVITHTFVSPDFRGQGLAPLLLNEVIKLAETEHRLIIPICSFASKVLEGNPKYKHLLG